MWKLDVWCDVRGAWCSVSLSSLDSEEQESLRTERLHNRSSRNSTGGISTHSLNEAELAVWKIHTHRKTATLLKILLTPHSPFSISSLPMCITFDRITVYFIHFSIMPNKQWAKPIVPLTVGISVIPPPTKSMILNLPVNLNTLSTLFFPVANLNRLSISSLYSSKNKIIFIFVSSFYADLNCSNTFSLLSNLIGGGGAK